MQTRRQPWRPARRQLAPPPEGWPALSPALLLGPVPGAGCRQGAWVQGPAALPARWAAGPAVHAGQQQCPGVSTSHCRHSPPAACRRSGATARPRLPRCPGAHLEPRHAWVRPGGPGNGHSGRPPRPLRFECAAAGLADHKASRRSTLPIANVGAARRAPCLGRPVPERSGRRLAGYDTLSKWRALQCPWIGFRLAWGDCPAGKPMPATRALALPRSGLVPSTCAG